MGEQQSQKKGVKSDAQKRAGTGNENDSTPAGGTFGKHAPERQSDKDAAFTLPDAKLEKLCAFWLTNGRGEEPDWYEVLAQARPEVVAKVVIQYTERAIKAKLEYVTGIWQLGRSAELAAVANIAIPPLLASFPARASQATPWVAGSASQGRPVEHGEGGTHRPGGA